MLQSTMNNKEGDSETKTDTNPTVNKYLDQKPTIVDIINDHTNDTIKFHDAGHHEQGKLYFQYSMYLKSKFLTFVHE